jgi:hypothetical protein
MTFFRITRDKKGRYSKKKISILTSLIIISIIFIGAMTQTQSYTVQAEIVDERDSIQKITDEIAVTYRELEETREALEVVQERHLKALEDYKSSLESFELYSN